MWGNGGGFFLDSYLISFCIRLVNWIFDFEFEFDYFLVISLVKVYLGFTMFWLVIRF